MCPLTVAVEDREDLDRFVVTPDRVRGHRRELRRITFGDLNRALAQLQSGGPRQDGEPFPARVHA